MHETIVKIKSMQVTQDERNTSGKTGPSAPAPKTGMNVEPGSRLISWTSLGIPEAWVKRALTPLCERFSDYLHWTESPSPEADPEEPADWDILFLGPEFAQPGLTHEAAMRRISRAHALGCVVAVTADPNPERHLELMRAGAVDVILRDTRLERVETALDLAISVLQARHAEAEQEKLRLIRQLAISINHEINNPLTGLLGTTELILLENKTLPEKTARDMRTIIEQARRIQEVTARLKNLNQLRSVPYGSHDTMLDLMSRPQEKFTTPTNESLFLPSPTILVVDDNPLIIDLFARLFEGRFQIHAASCAADALAMIENAPYDLVLIDLILPEMSGLELYRAIRRLRPRQRVMLMTGFYSDPRVEQALSEGVLGTIHKPFQIEQMEKMLVDVLKLR